MSSSPAAVGLLDRLLAGDPDREDFVDDDLAVVEDLFVILAEDLDRPGAAPRVDLLTALVEEATPARPMSRTLRIAVLSGTVVLAATGVAAAGGSLPDPLQAAAHGFAGAVGIEIPAAHEPGPPADAGSQDGPGHGRSDEAPGAPVEPGQPGDAGQPADPGQPSDPGRSTEAPGQPAVPGNDGATNGNSAPVETGPPTTPPTTPSNPNAGSGNSNAGGNGAGDGSETGSGANIGDDDDGDQDQDQDQDEGQDEDQDGDGQGSAKAPMAEGAPNESRASGRNGG